MLGSSSFICIDDLLNLLLIVVASKAQKIVYSSLNIVNRIFKIIMKHMSLFIYFRVYY
jgi:hypothetical protein